MGNCFSGESKDNFSGEGRTVGGSGGASQTSPPQAPRPVQSQPQARVKPSAGRTLGSTGSADDPRSAAARAAEARAISQGSGPLADKLAAQRKAGMQGALKEAANENRRARESDAVAETRHYN